MTASGRAYRRWMLAVLVAVGVCSWIDRQILAILMEAIKRDFALSDTQLGLLGGVAFGLFYAAVGLPVAWLADRFDRRNIIAASLALWSAMTALCGLATGFATLFLGRIGVGIGEAGGSPPSQSLIADTFPAEQRASALGVYFLNLPLGLMAGFLVGGWINEVFGWRQAFLVVGLPGIVLAGIVRLTLREPLREHLRGATDSPATRAAAGETHAVAASPWATARHFLRRGSMRIVPIAGAVHGIGAFGVAVWAPSYFMRQYELGSGVVGTYMAAAVGIGGGIGAVMGGRVADHYARRYGDARWHLWLSATAVLLAVPFGVAVYFQALPELAFACLFGSNLFGNMFLGPVMATVQGLAGSGRRAQGAAYYLFLANLVSMGLGPLIVGACSDLFRSRFGDDGLRFAMLSLFVTTSVLASALFVLATRSLRADLAAAETA